MRATVRSIAVIFALLLGLTACGGSSSSSGSGGGSASSGAPATTAGTPAGTSTTADIKNFSFVPQMLTVKVGTTVTWTNQDGADHTVTASDKSFDSENMGKGKTFQHTFDKPGTYAYICDIHQYMTGMVVVQ